ncbi:MAG: IS66 family transposase, partial [Pseudomonadales bacterium]|nr:IS66 family transposase [Pseudomonadales bacterium]
PSRSQQVPKRILEGFSGYLQADGYEGYNAVVAANGLVRVGCMAHARRRFSDAVKAQGKGKHKPTGKAQQGLAFIQKLYGVERRVREFSAEQRYAYRQQHAKPILEELRGWLDNSLPTVPPTSTTGKALNYLHKEWDKLIRYLDDGRLAIDNN